MTQPIQFDHSLEGEDSNINTIDLNVNGFLSTHYPHNLRTGNSIKIANSDTIYYVYSYGANTWITIHESPENAATGQKKIKNIGDVGDNLYTLVKTYDSVPVTKVENSLVSVAPTGKWWEAGNSFEHFQTGDKVRFAVNTLGGGSSSSTLLNASVKIIDGGDNFSIPPTINITAPQGANSVEATALPLLDPDGAIKKVIMTNPGYGYTSAPTVTLTGLSFTVKSISVTNTGSGYVTSPTVEVVGGGGSGATAAAVLDGMSGSWSIESITLITPGQGYSSAPTIKIIGGGVDRLDGIALTGGGSGYSSAPTVSFVGGGGAGATATASLTETVTDQWGYETTVTRDYVTSLTLTNNGSGYSTPPTVVFSGGGGSPHATATVSLEGINPVGTTATATASIGSSTADLQGNTEGTLGTLQNELVDEIETGVVYFVNKVSSTHVTIHRTRQDAMNNVRPLDFGADNIFSGVAITKIINDPAQSQTSAPPMVSSTLLTHNVLKNTVTLPVENANGFESGKNIIIDENDPCDEETNTILRATPTYLVLTRGLAFSHEKNNPVRLVLPNEQV